MKKRVLSNVYFAMFKMKLISGLQYRVAAWAGVCTQFFWGFMYIMIYQAFYGSSSYEPAISFEQMVSYLWLQQAFLAIIMIWSQDTNLLGDITEGNVSYELCRPYDMYVFWYMRLIATRISAALLRCYPILIIASFLPKPYNMNLPASFTAGLLFIISMSIATILVVAVSMFIYIFTFITLSPHGVRLIIGIGAEFLSGGTIPIPLMPQWLQNVLFFLPFRYTADLPFRVYSGNISGSDATFGILTQILWSAALIYVGMIAFKKVIKHIVIQGG